MPGLVGAHAQNQFTDPQAGQSPIASAQVRANDNANATTLTAHDADATIHIQSSSLASRPAASTAQRVWITTDGKRFYLDSGSVWNEIDYLNKTDGGTVAGATTFSASTTFGTKIIMTTAASQLVPGATSFAIRNNADNANNFIITNAGAVTILSTNTASQHIASSPGGASAAAFDTGQVDDLAAGNGMYANPDVSGSNTRRGLWFTVGGAAKFIITDADGSPGANFLSVLLWSPTDSLFLPVFAGANGTGPGGVGKALYTPNV